jgi:uncharacterized DUF497 family protein
MSDAPVKPFRWNDEKNNQLRSERGIGFEALLTAINAGQVLEIVEHPNQERYPGQQIFMVQIDQYVFAVPFVENEAEIFLKTIIPSRKMTRKYLGG